MCKILIKHKELNMCLFYSRGRANSKRDKMHHSPMMHHGQMIMHHVPMMIGEQLMVLNTIKWTCAVHSDVQLCISVTVDEKGTTNVQANYK